MARILIFIDESNTSESTERLFMSCGVWCSPRINEGSNSTLKPTVGQLKRIIKARTGRFPDEIHYSGGLWRYAEELISQCMVECHNDCTLPNIGHPWEGDKLGFSISFSHHVSEICLPPGIISGRPSLDLRNIIRARMISDLLMPLIIYNGSIDMQISLNFDSANWKKAASYFGNRFEKIISNPHISIDASYLDSKETPGIQIADLCAGICRDHMRGKIDSTSYRHIMDNEISRIGYRPIGVSPTF